MKCLANPLSIFSFFSLSSLTLIHYRNKIVNHCKQSCFGSCDHFPSALQTISNTFAFGHAKITLSEYNKEVA